MRKVSLNSIIIGRMAQLLRRAISCLYPPGSSFTDQGSIPDQDENPECPGVLPLNKYVTLSVI